MRACAPGMRIGSDRPRCSFLWKECFGRLPTHIPAETKARCSTCGLTLTASWTSPVRPHRLPFERMGGDGRLAIPRHWRFDLRRSAAALQSQALFGAVASSSVSFAFIVPADPPNEGGCGRFSWISRAARPPVVAPPLARSAHRRRLRQGSHVPGCMPALRRRADRPAQPQCISHCAHARPRAGFLPSRTPGIPIDPSCQRALPLRA